MRSLVKSATTVCLTIATIGSGACTDEVPVETPHPVEQQFAEMCADLGPEPALLPASLAEQDGHVLTKGELRTLCCLLPHHFPRIALASENDYFADYWEHYVLPQGMPSFEELASSLAICNPEFVVGDDLACDSFESQLPSGVTVGQAKAEVYAAEQAAITGTPAEALLRDLPLGEQVLITDVPSSHPADPGPPSLPTPEPDEPVMPLPDEPAGGPEFDRHNAAYISVGLTAIYYGLRLFLSEGRRPDGEVPGQMPFPGVAPLDGLNMMNIMAISPAEPVNAAAQFLSVVGEDCIASQGGVTNGNAGFNNRCWGALRLGASSTSWKAAVDYRHRCRKVVRPNAGDFNGRDVTVWFTRQLTPQIRNFTSYMSAQAWPTIRFHTLLPDVNNYGQAARAERGVDARMSYDYTCHGWFRPKTYSNSVSVTAWGGAATYAAIN